jgi:hypothetical protein
MNFVRMIVAKLAGLAETLMAELAGLRTNDEEEFTGLVKMMMVRARRTRENDDGWSSPDSRK